MRSSYGWASLGLPLALYYLLIFVAAQITFLRASLYESAGPARLGAGPTLSNYTTMLSDSYYVDAFRQSVLVAAAVSIVGLILAFPVAYMIAQSKSRLAGLLLAVVLGLMFSNAVIRTLGWRILLSENGPVNDVLLRLRFVSSPVRLLDSYLGVIIGLTHAQLPLFVVALVPVCQTISPNLIHASMGLGASRSRTFWKIIMPITAPGVLATTMLIFASTIGAFTTPALLGGGRVLMLPILIRERMITAFNWAEGATLATLLTLLVILIVGISIVVGRSRMLYIGER